MLIPIDKASQGLSIFIFRNFDNLITASFYYQYQTILLAKTDHRKDKNGIFRNGAKG
jgi:hypothetical protein